jgi:hypothetical protein
VIIVAESHAESELLSRRLPALRHIFGPEIQIKAPSLLTGTGDQDGVLHLDRTLRTLLLQDSAARPHQ